MTKKAVDLSKYPRLVPMTECKTKTNSVIVHTKHGAVRKEVIQTIVKDKK